MTGPESKDAAPAAGKDDDVRGKYLSSDSTTSVNFNDYWGRWTQTGVHGDPRSATAEKGKVIFEAAVGGLLGLVEEAAALAAEQASTGQKIPLGKTDAERDVLLCVCVGAPATPGAPARAWRWPGRGGASCAS